MHTNFVGKHHFYGYGLPIPLYSPRNTSVNELRVKVWQAKTTSTLW